MSSLDSHLDDQSTKLHNQTSRFTNDFVCVEELGKGGFGVVYKVENKLDLHEYAVKKIRMPFSFDEEEKEKAVREVKALATLNHPNIIKYYHAWKENSSSTFQSSRSSPTSTQKSLNNKFTKLDLDKENKSTECCQTQEVHGKRKGMSSEADSEFVPSKRYCLRNVECFLFIQMELMKMDLQQWMWKTKNRRREVVRDMMGGILSALAYIHKKGYMHRDLTPSNIFLTHENKVKIGDFGLVKIIYHNAQDMLNEDNDEHTLGVGNTLYMSPEYIESKPYGYPVDVYAAGVIWLELLHYFTEVERSKILRDLQKGIFPVRLSAKIPMEYEMITSMTAKDPDARPTADLACNRFNEMYINNRCKKEELVLKQILHKDA